MSKQIEPHILDFFEIKQLLGSGAYGHVWKVLQKSSGRQYALKKIFDAFQNSTDAQRTYREINILRQLDHQNIIKLKGVIKAANQKDLYLVFQHMEADLHSLVGQNILQQPHLLYIIYQIFKALKYIHSAQLLHRDLKPSNILINSECEIKICDFGLVRSLARQEDTRLVLSEDVATRWYRSPQMLLGCQNYGPATDVWSVGCIIAQLMIGRPLLMGDSNIQQLEKILQLTGIPKNEDIETLQKPAIQKVIQNLRVLKKPFKFFFKETLYEKESEIINFVRKMLQFNPNKRITVEQALGNPIFQGIKCKSQQKICQKFIVPTLDDNLRLRVQDYRETILFDIQRQYPQFNKKINEEQLQPTRYERGHYSLIKRPDVSSIQRKGCNSLFRPKRKYVTGKNTRTYIQSIKRENVSMHDSSENNSSIYKKKLVMAEQKKYYDSIQKLSENSVNNCPFRRYRKKISPANFVNPISKLEKIKGLQELQEKSSIEKQNMVLKKIYSPDKLSYHGKVEPILRAYNKNSTQILQNKNIIGAKVSRKTLTKVKKQKFEKSWKNKQQEQIYR